ncbi:M48 family metallopeptidase [Jeotgalibacillus haloalkalitolerans]|uniref:M48 family metalloprotease n=1 Tax=Jeotgalibacillus haloalkalitolerans TaxID=3104292 RepID=A0ABU5KIL9_9BACL|nr:M48 family metalloprotease [Jeotgalibacillus sp. HH7-29]MDZ5710771.1 M48 family metalloprotease [Jeotgalibacillus sp. HH7-29]
MEVAVKIETCSACGEQIEVVPGYVKWCEHCLDQVQERKREEPPKHWMAKIFDWLGRKQGDQLLKGVLSKQTEKPGLTLKSGMAYIVATLIHMTSILLFATGLYCLIALNETVAAIFAGVILLAISWLARPRVQKLERDETVLTADELPELFSLLDEVSSALGSPKIDGVVINGDYNASIAYYGWKKRVILKIGAPLLIVLDHEERTALFGHEIGHLVNGDLNRSGYIGTALFTIYTWVSVLIPERTTVYDTGLLDYMDEVNPVGLGPLNWISQQVQRVIAFFPKMIFLTLLYLLYQNMQRAEYYADQLAASVAGKEAAISMLKKLEYVETFLYSLRKTVIGNGKVHFLTELKEQFAQLPAKEKLRIQKISELEKSRADDTHPPTAYRLQYIESRNERKPLMKTDSPRMKRVELEMAVYSEKAAEEVVEFYRYYKYS